MAFLSKLLEIGPYGGVSGFAANVADAPAELPRIDVNLRRGFRQPESSASMLARATLDKTDLPNSAASVPAAMPEIDVAIPTTIPDPPPPSGAKPVSGSRA